MLTPRRWISSRWRKSAMSSARGPREKPLIEPRIEEVLTCKCRAKRYERLLKANGIHPSGGSVEATSSPKLAPSAKKKKKDRDDGEEATAAQTKKRKLNQKQAPSVAAYASKSASPPAHESVPDTPTLSKRMDGNDISDSPEPPREALPTSPSLSLPAPSSVMGLPCEENSDQAQMEASQGPGQHEVLIPGVSPAHYFNSHGFAQYPNPYSTTTQPFSNSSPFATMSGLAASSQYQSSLSNQPHYAHGFQDSTRHMLCSGGMPHPRSLVVSHFPQYRISPQAQEIGHATETVELEHD